MSTKSQRKKQKQQKKRQQEDRRQRKQREQAQQQVRRAAQGNTRHRERLERQKPCAWDGELTEDVAVFDDTALATLPPDLAVQVSGVRDALQLTSEGRGEDALKLVSAIPRRSLLSEWRLFIRGLAAWLANDAIAADEAWKRLNPERRAGRIAAAMMNGLRPDLETVGAQIAASHPSDGASDEPSERWLHRLDGQLLYHARLLRRVRLDRAAIRVAEAGVRIPEESRKLKLGPQKVAWLQRFADDHRPTEPGLVAALERVALARVFAQNFSDLFETAAAAIRGPRHDPNNRLLSYFYYIGFSNDSDAQQRAAQSLDTYLTKDLPENPELSPPLRQAIASQIHLNEAGALIHEDGPAFPFAFRFQEEDTPGIKKHFEASVRACPENRRAYQAHVEWLESKLDNDRLTKPKRQPLLKQLAAVMQKWAKGLPEDIEPRLWLVDHFLENEQTELAEPHVEWLAASRHEDPRVRAAPWKWTLLEAMRLSRRKAWLSKVPPQLDGAEQKWPTWLSKQWLPYLKGACLLRAGKLDEFEQARQRICSESGLARDSVADACMMLGAAQRMLVPAADLKPLRKPVDDAVKNLKRLPAAELLEASPFFWDLYRTQLFYPAFRMHGGKFARELLGRLDKEPGRLLSRLDDPQIQAAVLWNSEFRFWGDGYELKLPKFFATPDINRHPIYVAAKANGHLHTRALWRTEEYPALSAQLREASASQRDPYYRYWFNSLANGLDEAVEARASKSFGGFAAFNRMFDPGGFSNSDNEDDAAFYDGDTDEDFDPECDCPNCRAARARHEASL